MDGIWGPERQYVPVKAVGGDLPERDLGRSCTVMQLGYCGVEPWVARLNCPSRTKGVLKVAPRIRHDDVERGMSMGCGSR